MKDEAAGGRRPKVLVFSTNRISDLGIDMAGSSHMAYSPTVRSLAVPCSSSIKPDWIVYALRSGFDGVFVAADGSDCASVPDCTERTARLVDEAQQLARDEGIDARRIKMAAVCSVCAESFVSLVTGFSKALAGLAEKTDTGPS